MFPGAHATIYTNEAGEPTGWSDESYDDPSNPDAFYDYDDYDDYDEDDYDEDDEDDEDDG